MSHWRDVLPGRVLEVHYEDVVADLEGQCAGCWILRPCVGGRVPAFPRDRAGDTHREFGTRYGARSTQLDRHLAAL
jgi:hypothetical protein